MVVGAWLDIYDIGRLTRIARHDIAAQVWGSEPRFDPRTGHLQLPVYQIRGPDDRHVISYLSELDLGGQFRVVGRLDGGVINDVAWTTAGMVFHSAQSRRLLLQGPSGERTELPAERPGPFFAVAATGDAVYSDYDGALTNVIRLRRPDGRVVTLGRGHHDFTPDISRDGRWIVFIRDGRDVVLCERPEGNAPRCETIVKNVALMERGRVRVSPDGGQVAFLVRETTTAPPFLRVFSREDGQVRDLGEVQLTSCPLHWGAGRTIWHVSSSPVEWVGADAETGRVVQRSGKPGMRLAGDLRRLPAGRAAEPLQDPGRKAGEHPPVGAAPLSDGWKLVVQRRSHQGEPRNRATACLISGACGCTAKPSPFSM